MPPSLADPNPLGADVKTSLMREALREARKAGSLGEIPAGAVVCDPRGEILGRGRNRVISLTDPTAHAEILALREASLRMGNHRLTDLILVSTLEPCLMCLAASLEARLRGIVYGAPEPKRGALISSPVLPSFGGANHRFAFVEGGVLEEECAGLMRAFFIPKRKKRKGEVFPPPEGPPPCSA
ncbi:MAG: nucleoside deaminase [Deltaproteobacteria bacterium]|nr:nucleoside deaminase [Deltaproteobacteria bacterium]